MGRHGNFRQVTPGALDDALDAFTIEDTALRNDLIGAYRKGKCYSDIPETLQTLKQRGLRLAIPCNGSHRPCWKGP